MIYFAFIADLMLFIFPLYQGKMELMESNDVFSKYQASGKQKFNITFLYWLFPPLLFRHYHQQLKKHAGSLVKNKIDFNQAYNFYNKAIAWYFVSYAGFLHACISADEVLEKLNVENYHLLILIISVMFIFFAGNGYVDYLCSNKRKKWFIYGFIKSIKKMYLK